MKEVKKEINLLEVRKKALESAVNGSIRPHGKLWGMDVFSWNNPSIEAMNSTIHSFPFPIIWLASAELLTDVVTADSTVLSNIHATISYENQLLIEVDFPNLVKTNNVQQAFQAMNDFRLKRGVILFCHSGVDSEFHQNAFKAYLELHQI